MEDKNKRVSLIRTSQPDYWLLIAVFFLLGIGTVMVFSSSTVSSYLKPGSDSYSLLKNQLLYAGMGIIVLLLASLFSYRFIEKISLAIYAFSVVMLALVLVIGKNINNAKRWIYIGPVSFQPSEFAKFGMIALMAFLLSNENTKEIVKKWWGFIIYLVPMGIVFLLLYEEPHASCIIIIGLVCAIMMLVSRVNWRHFAVLAILGVGGIALMYATVAHFRTRINTFLGIGGAVASSASSDYQVTQSLYAIGSGGLTGRGLGQSVQKYQYLPEPYNDFIFAILAEELGFIGAFIVILLFGILIWRGFKIASYAPDKYSCLLATGITSLIAVQTVLNIAVVTKTIPVTGVALPFFSYGGTSLIIIMAEMGVLIGISKKAAYSKF